MSAVAVCGWGPNDAQDPLSFMLALGKMHPLPSSLSSSFKGCLVCQCLVTGEDALPRNSGELEQSCLRGKEEKSCFFPSCESPVLHFIFIFLRDFCLKC